MHRCFAPQLFEVFFLWLQDAMFQTAFLDLEMVPTAAPEIVIIGLSVLVRTHA